MAMSRKSNDGRRFKLTQTKVGSEFRVRLPGSGQIRGEFNSPQAALKRARKVV
jgi:hypothetical protein